MNERASCWGADRHWPCQVAVFQLADLAQEFLIQHNRPRLTLAESMILRPPWKQPTLCFTRLVITHMVGFGGSLGRQQQEVLQAQAAQAVLDAKATKELEAKGGQEDIAEEFRKEKLRQFKAERESQRRLSRKLTIPGKERSRRSGGRSSRGGGLMGGFSTVGGDESKSGSVGAAVNDVLKHLERARSGGAAGRSPEHTSHSQGSQGSFGTSFGGIPGSEAFQSKSGEPARPPSPPGHMSASSRTSSGATGGPGSETLALQRQLLLKHLLNIYCAPLKASQPEVGLCLSQQLTSMGVLDPDLFPGGEKGLFPEDPSAIRALMQSHFKEEVALAPSLGPAVERFWSNFEYAEGSSRYLSDFAEMESLGRGGFGEVCIYAHRHDLSPKCVLDPEFCIKGGEGAE